MSPFGTSTSAEVILVVEDAESIRKMVCSMLTQAGYNCLEAVDGSDALQLIERTNGLTLVLTDMLMPKMGGPELARHLARLRPEVRVVFMSGYTDDPYVREIGKRP